jgi:membrane-associated phospholipid phosphatase
MNIPEHLRRIPLKPFLFFAIFLIALLSFGVMVHEIFYEKEQEFDEEVASFVNEYFINDKVTKVMKGLTFLASREILWIVYLLLILWQLLIKKDKRLALDIAIIGLFGYVLTYSLKEVFQRVRPLDPLVEPLKTYSFPSGHASSGFILYGLVAWLIYRSALEKRTRYALTGLFVLISLLIGASRIYLSAHYASDVLAGFCIGFLWLGFMIWFIERRTHGRAENKTS